MALLIMYPSYTLLFCLAMLCQENHTSHLRLMSGAEERRMIDSSPFNIHTIHPISLSVYLLLVVQHSIIKTHVPIPTNTSLTVSSVSSVVSSLQLYSSVSFFILSRCATDLPTFTHLDPLLSLYNTALSLSVPRPCCVSICFPRAPGGITSCLRRINDFRHFCYFSTGFISFMKNFNSFLSRAAVLRFRLKFK